MFREQSNGQMSLCFVEHYSLDPTFKDVSHGDLVAICASRKHASGKGSFAAFLACASNHWDPVLDKDLAVIKAARANSTAHAHPESSAPVATNIEHEEEELSMISEVVNKVLGNSGGNLNEKNTDVKVIDVNGGKTTAAPAVPNVNGSSRAALVAQNGTTLPPKAPINKSLLSDPNNTVMVFLTDKTTPAPLVHPPAVNSTVHLSANATTTIKPAANLTSTHSVEIKTTAIPHSGNNSTKLAPALSTKAPLAINGTTIKPVTTNGTTTVAPTTLKPTEKVASTLAPKSITTAAPVTTPASNATTAAPATKLPQAAPSSTTTKAPPASTTTTTSMPTTTVKPTLKPIDTLEKILQRQEKEKQDLENKLKAERTKAIAQLKKQDDAHSHHSSAADAKIHQIEHERQMVSKPLMSFFPL